MNDDVNSNYGFMDNGHYFDINDPSGTTEYYYDDNGNMITDLNKGIIAIEYNHLNLPIKIEFENNRRIHYIYDANGVKLRKTYYEDNLFVERTDYSGGFVYKDGHIDYYLTSEGRMKYDESESIYHAEYFLKDHLGNVRVVLNTDPERLLIAQITDYYPFGGEIPISGTDDNQIKYNSKELQTEAGLGWYDYGARFYDGQLGRFHSVDPMTHEREWLSPYNFCSLNPINRVDPNGALDDWYETPEGEKKYDENIHSAKDLKEKGIEGNYLGKTYKEGDNYYSLFGQEKDLKTMEGKLYEKIDQTLTNYANLIKEYDQNAWEEPIERSADFNIGVPFKKNAFGYSDYNDYTFNYEGATGYYQVYGDPSTMKGKLDWGKNILSGNKNYSFGNMRPGYNTHIYVAKSPRLDIVTLVFLL